MRSFLVQLAIGLLVVSTIAVLANPVRPNRDDDGSSGCDKCQGLMPILGQLLTGDQVNATLGEVVALVCDLLKIEDSYVCKTIVSSFKETVLYVLSHAIAFDNDICSMLFANCTGMGVLNPFDTTWRLPLPGTPKNYQRYPLKGGEKKLRILHLSDLHIDQYYVTGSEVDCGEPLCCRDFNQNEIMAADAGKAVKTPAGKWGTVGHCDIPYWTVEHLLKHIAATHTDLDYAVISGDLESHTIWQYTQEAHVARITNITNMFRQHLPNLTVYFALGNHEAVPMDNYAPQVMMMNGHEVDLWEDGGWGMDWLYGPVGAGWQQWIGPNAASQFNQSGCYSLQLFNRTDSQPGLKLISLNNGLGSSLNFFGYMNQTDPDGVLQWLIGELDAAEKVGDRVHIVAHIPGADSESEEGWAINYYNIINRYRTTVTGQFFGHTHSEKFWMMYEDPDDYTSTPTNVVYSAPSVTTESEFNPAYRIYTINGPHNQTNYEVLDWEEWFLNLTKANALPERVEPTWEVLYDSVLQEYGMASTEAAEWDALIERMKNDDYVVDLYRKNYYRRDDVGPCDMACKHDLLCSARQSHKNVDGLCPDLPGASPQKSLFFGTKAGPMPSEQDVRRAIHELVAKKQN